MVKIFLYKRLGDLPYSYLVNLFFTEEEEAGLLFQKVPSAPFKNMIQFVNGPQEADYMMLPHAYFSLKNKFDNYLNEARKFASENNLKLIIFAYGDIHEDIVFDDSIILRTARYKTKLRENEVILSPFVEDLGERHGVEFIAKTMFPIVGFTGMVGLPSVYAELKYKLRLFLSLINEILGKSEICERQGLYFRRKLIKVLSSAKSIQFKAQKRKSYSAARSTIQGDPLLVRKEFVDSIKESHLPLVVRGDGNFSLRFFEVLSLGRVPLFIDTDTPLPLEDEIDYDSFILRVGYKDIKKIPEIVEEFWKKTSPEKFIEMQKKARNVFETKLRSDVFYKELFIKLEKKKQINSKCYL